MDQKILTTGEAADLCGVSRSTLRRAVAQGQLKAWHTPGKHLRFTREACEEFAGSLGRYDLVGRPVSSASELEVSGVPVREGSASR
ncbi:MAG: helix-turn-helix domain-containing protein [Candidatus Dormibacteria bacterium]